MLFWSHSQLPSHSIPTLSLARCNPPYLHCATLHTNTAGGKDEGYICLTRYWCFFLLVVAKAEGDGGDAEGGERKGRAAAETRGRGLQVCNHAPWHMEGGGEAKRGSHCLPLCVDLIMLHLSCAYKCQLS